MSAQPGPFDHVKFNEDGYRKSQGTRLAFQNLLVYLESQCGGSAGGREFALVKTNLQTAAFWAQKAIAESSENREG